MPNQLELRRRRGRERDRPGTGHEKVRLHARERRVPTQRRARANTERGGAEPARRAFFQTRERARPAERALIGKPMHGRSVSRGSAGGSSRAGREHVHLVTRAQQTRHFAVHEVTRGVPGLPRIRSADDGDAFAQERGSSPKAFTASAPCAASISPSVRR